MRVLLTSVTCPKGMLDTNLARHLDLLRVGAGNRVDLVLLPEMSLTGYRPAAAISLANPAVTSLVRATAGAPALCFGLVEHAPAGAPYITQVVAADGTVVAVHHKAHLGEGEHGAFQPGAPGGVFNVAGTPCAVAICAEIGTAAPYRSGCRLVLGPSAPGLYGERRRTDADWQRGYAWWHGTVRDDASRLLGLDQVLAVSTQSGATDDEDFPGWAGALGPAGRVIAELPDWREGTIVADLDLPT